MTKIETIDKMYETLKKSESFFNMNEKNEPIDLSARHLNRFINIHLYRDLFLKLDDEIILEHKLSGVSNMTNYIKKLNMWTTARDRNNKTKKPSNTKKSNTKRSQGHVSKKETYGYVYLLKMANENNVKIGHAGVLWKRIKSLSHYDFDFNESFYIKCRPKQAHKVEKFLHFMYGDYSFDRNDQMDGADEFFDEMALNLFLKDEADYFHIKYKHAVQGVYKLTDDISISKSL